MLIVFMLTELLCSCSKQVYILFSCLSITGNGKFLDLYLKSILKKILFISVLKENEKWNKIKLWTFLWTWYVWNKCNMENVIFFW